MAYTVRKGTIFIWSLVCVLPIDTHFHSIIIFSETISPFCYLCFAIAIELPIEVSQSKTSLALDIKIIDGITSPFAMG